MSIEPPYLLFLGDAQDQLAAKTAAGVARWRPDKCMGQLRFADCKADVGLADFSLEQAVAKGAKTLVIGVATRGGAIPESWEDSILKAIRLGMDVASGLHQRVADRPELRQAADALGRRIVDVRHPDRDFSVATGENRAGKRLLAVGTDCSIGKMYTALAIEAEMHRRSVKATFRATGQTGIFIAGSGVSIDAVIADFISGAVEWLCPENEDDHWDIVEGQGSLFHPSFAGVSMGLLHGAQPDALVLCHEPGREHMRGLPGRPLPPLDSCMALNEQAARIVNPAAQTIGLSINTSTMNDGQAEGYLKGLEDRFSLPAVDPVRTGVGKLVDRVEALWP